MRNATPLVRGSRREVKGHGNLVASARLAFVFTISWVVLLGLSGFFRSEPRAQLDRLLLPIVLQNEYTDALGPIGLEYPWTSEDKQVIDAYKPFRACVSGVTPGRDECHTILDVDDRQRTAINDISTDRAPGMMCASMEALPPGDFHITVTCVQNGQTNSVRMTALSRYVRREIRELTKDDRTRWLDAMAIVFYTDGDEGRKIYGSTFRSSAEISSLHAINAGMRDGDHLHRGLGFLAQHLRQDGWLTASLQSVDSSISAPYWDWTIDEDLLSSGIIDSIYDSPIFTPDMFGSPNFVSSPTFWMSHLAALVGVSQRELTARGMLDFAIRDGRFQMIRVPRSPSANSNITQGQQIAREPRSPYGYIRSPWNTNPSPFVTRFHIREPMWSVQDLSLYNPTHLPACSDLYSLFAIVKDGAPTSQLFLEMETKKIHARAHWVIGGIAFDENKMNAALAALPSEYACPEPFVDKYIWRQWLADMPAACESTDPLRECALELPGHNANPASQDRKIGELVIATAACNKSRAYQTNLTAAKLTEIGRFWRQALILYGDALDSSSPADPAFHIIHPTLARYFQYSYLVNPELVDDWYLFDDGPACIQYSCIALNGEPGSFQQCCAGHYRNSTIFVDILGSVAAKGTDLDVTNEKILASVVPWNSRSDAAVFHHFRWDHCAKSNYDMRTLLSSTNTM